MRLNKMQMMMWLILQAACWNTIHLQHVNSLKSIQKTGESNDMQLIRLMWTIFIENFLIFSPLTVENFRDIIKMICEDVINMAIAENIIYEMIKNPTISARKVYQIDCCNFIFHFYIFNNSQKKKKKISVCHRKQSTSDERSRRVAKIMPILCWKIW